jgi:RNA-directed DNA polymerase
LTQHASQESEALMNIGEQPWPDPVRAAMRVRQMQRKLHHWAVSDPGRRFDDVFNLVYHPDFLTLAWERVRGNKGARTAGVDRVSPVSIAEDGEVVEFLGQVREQLKSRTFAPLPLRERLIPKPNSSKLRRLGIPTAMDRVVQASLVLVLEPIFEADFKPVSYGFRPKRRAQDAIAEIHTFGSRNYHWVFEADIAACFDELEHSAVMDRVRLRIADKRVLALVKAFLTAGVMSADGQIRDSDTGTPQGGIVSPLLANIALSVLDEHFCKKWDAQRTSQRRDAHRKRGGATYRIVRYADDFVIMVAGTKAHADALWDEVAEVIAPLGLRLSAEKSRVCHLDEGFVFLGFRIQRRRKKGTTNSSVYTYPSKKALLSIMAKVRALTKKERHHSLADLLGRLNPVLRGWCAYFRHGVSKATFGYLDSFVWHRVTQWLLKRHKQITWAELYRRFLTARPGNRPAAEGITMFDAATVPITRYRWRANNIPTPWISSAGTPIPA